MTIISNNYNRENIYLLIIQLNENFNFAVFKFRKCTIIYILINKDY